MPQAVVILDDPTAIRLATVKTPKCLTPINGVPLLHHTLTWLSQQPSSVAITEVFLVTSRDAAPVRSYLSSTRWASHLEKSAAPSTTTTTSTVPAGTKPGGGEVLFPRLRIISAASALSPGDALRWLDELGVLSGDESFVLVEGGGVVGNASLAGAWASHVGRVKGDPNTTLTLCCSPGGGGGAGGVGGSLESSMVALDSRDGRLWGYRPMNASRAAPGGWKGRDEPTSSGAVASAFSAALKGLPKDARATTTTPTILPNHALRETGVYIAAPQVVVHFTDNQDYTCIRRHYIRHESANVDMGWRFHVHALGGYLAPVGDARAVLAVGRDLALGWVGSGSGSGTSSSSSSPPTPWTEAELEEAREDGSGSEDEDSGDAASATKFSGSVESKLSHLATLVSQLSPPGSVQKDGGEGLFSLGQLLRALLRDHPFETHGTSTHPALALALSYLPYCPTTLVGVGTSPTATTTTTSGSAASSTTTANAGGGGGSAAAAAAAATPLVKLTPLEQGVGELVACLSSNPSEALIRNVSLEIKALKHAENASFSGVISALVPHMLAAIPRPLAPSTLIKTVMAWGPLLAKFVPGGGGGAGMEAEMQVVAGVERGVRKGKGKGGEGALFTSFGLILNALYDTNAATATAIQVWAEDAKELVDGGGGGGEDEDEDEDEEVVGGGGVTLDAAAVEDRKELFQSKFFQMLLDRVNEEEEEEDEEEDEEEED